MVTLDRLTISLGSTLERKLRMTSNDLSEKIRHDWQRFLQGLPSSGGVRDIIFASWGRSRAAGVNPEPDGLPLRRISDDDLSCRLRDNQELLSVAIPHLEWATLCMTRVPHVVYLTDRDGIVLHAVGNHPARESLGLIPGYDWSETTMGTNGAGTALATEHPVAVIGPEHYSRPFQDCTCTGAPIHSPDGELIGAVDISTSVADGGPERLAAAAHLSYSIGRELKQPDANPATALLPICTYCKDVWSESAGWNRVEAYLTDRFDIRCSHGICPECWKLAIGSHLKEFGVINQPGSAR